MSLLFGEACILWRERHWLIEAKASASGEAYHVVATGSTTNHARCQEALNAFGQIARWTVPRCRDVLLPHLDEGLVGIVLNAGYHEIQTQRRRELPEDVPGALVRCTSACIPARAADLLRHTEGAWLPEEIYQKVRRPLWGFLGA